eukprot:7629669-Ditylum_brightwellii.AAC.1
MVYKAELDEWLKRKRIYEENLFKAYTLLWERCAKSMRNKIASRTDYKSSIYNDPVILLRAIKEHLLNFQETRYEMVIIMDAFRTSFNTKQKENESLQDCTRRFKTSKDILESHLQGQILLEMFVATTGGYDANNKDSVVLCSRK